MAGGRFGIPGCCAAKNRGLLATSLIFDIVFLITGDGQFAEVSFWMISAGIIGGLLAAIFGLVDWLAIPANTRAKAIGMWHGIGNVLVTGLFIVSWLLRRDNIRNPDTAAIVLSFAGIALALVTSWLGGELVGQLGIGVDRGAHPNSPSSLSDLPATDQATKIGPGAQMQ